MNDISEMKGGKLEIMQHDKHYALDLLSKGKDYKCEAVGYERPGKMILAQGSEILHHVTPVENKCTRYFNNNKKLISIFQTCKLSLHIQCSKSKQSFQKIRFSNLTNSVFCTIFIFH